MMIVPGCVYGGFPLFVTQKFDVCFSREYVLEVLCFRIRILRKSSAKKIMCEIKDRFCEQREGSQ